MGSDFHHRNSKTEQFNHQNKKRESKRNPTLGTFINDKIRNGKNKAGVPVKRQLEAPHMQDPSPAGPEENTENKDDTKKHPNQKVSAAVLISMQQEKIASRAKRSIHRKRANHKGKKLPNDEKEDLSMIDGEDHDSGKSDVSQTKSVFSNIDKKTIQSYYASNNEQSIRHTTSVLTTNNEGRKRVNQYVLGRTIGRGNFGKVKKAVNLDDGCIYAIKILKRNFLAKKTKSDIDNELDCEISIKKKMAHPFIVKLFEVIED